MFDWLKPKKPPVKEATSQTQQTTPQTREQIVAEAMKNARAAREAIGEENLEKLAQLIQKKKQQEETSPASQAKKIIAQMDKDKLGDFLKYMVREDQTKH